MRRRLFNFFTLLSLLLCLAMAGLWIRSYWIIDDARGRTERLGSVSALSMEGYATVGYRTPLKGETASWRWDRFHDKGALWLQISGWGYSYEHWMDTVSPQSTWHGFGFTTNEISYGWPRTPKSHSVVVDFRHWAAVVLTALLPGLWPISRWRRRKQNRAGLCPKCGYDLRASQVRCPECGTPIPAKVEAKA